LKKRSKIRFAPGFDPASRLQTLQDRLFLPKKIKPRFGEGSGRAGGGRTATHNVRHLDSQFCVTVLPKLSFIPNDCPKCTYTSKLWRLWIEWSAFKREPFLEEFDLLSEYSRYWYEPNSCQLCAATIAKKDVSTGYRLELGKGWVRCECVDTYLRQLRQVTPEREAFEAFAKAFEARYGMEPIIAFSSPKCGEWSEQSLKDK
jgi:hypothetical protein